MNAAERSYPRPVVRGCHLEELPPVRGKEQRLRFAGTAMKRYSTYKVREIQVKMVGIVRGHQKADALKP